MATFSKVVFSGGTSGGASAMPTWAAAAAGDSDQIVIGVQVFS